MQIKQLAKYETGTLAGVYKYSFIEKGFYVILYRVSSSIIPANSIPFSVICADLRYEFTNFNFKDLDLWFKAMIPIEQASSTVSNIQIIVRWLNYTTNAISNVIIDTFNMPVSIKIKYVYAGSGWTDYPDTSAPDDLYFKTIDETGALSGEQYISNYPYYQNITYLGYRGIELGTRLFGSRSFGRPYKLHDFFSKNAEWDERNDGTVPWSDNITFQIYITPSENLFCADFIPLDKIDVYLKESYEADGIKYTTTDYPEIIAQFTYNGNNYPNTSVTKDKKIVANGEVTRVNTFIKLEDENGINTYLYNNIPRDIFDTEEFSLSNPIQFTYDSSRQAHKVKALYSLNSIQFIEPPALIVPDVFSITNEIRRVARCYYATVENENELLLKFEPGRHQPYFSYVLEIVDTQLGFTGEFYEDGDLGGIIW